MVLTYVLGPLIERSARQTLALSPTLVFHRPIFWGFILMGALTTWFTRRLWRAAA